MPEVIPHRPCSRLLRAEREVEVLLEQLHVSDEAPGAVRHTFVALSDLGVGLFRTDGNCEGTERRRSPPGKV